MADIKGMKQTYRKAKDVTSMNPLILLSALKEMRDNKEFTDILLICNGVKFPAHRNILSAHSAYFKRMFQSGFKESVTGEVDFSYVDKNIMQLILDYMYTISYDTFSNEDPENIMKILTLAHLFELKDLSEYCRNLLLSQLNTDNCFNIWNKFLLHETELEVEKVIKYVIRNLPNIALKQEFVDLNDIQMLSILMKLKERNIPVVDDFLEGFVRWCNKNNSHHNEQVQDVFLSLNFEFVSKESMNIIVEDDTITYLDEPYKKFLKLQVIPKLKPKKSLCNIVQSSSSSNLIIKDDIQLKFFYFGCYRININGCYMYEQAGLRIFDCETNTLRCIDDLPILYSTDIVPIQCGCDIYILGGSPKRTKSTKGKASEYFFLYNSKANSVIEKPAFPSRMFQSLTCVVKKTIYVIMCAESNNCVVYCYSTNEEKWEKAEWSVPKVVACVNLNDVLYLICWKNYCYYLYLLTNNQPHLQSNIPIMSSGCGKSNCTVVIEQKCVTTIKSRMFILPRYDAVWYIYYSEFSLWKIIKYNFSPLDYCWCFAVDNEYLMLYDETKFKLYSVDEECKQVTEIFTVKGSLRNSSYSIGNLYFSKFERVLIYQ